MARWQLREAHYLNVPGSEWEYKEVSQQTGRQERRVYKVPAYLEEGTIVCLPGKGLIGDTEFEDTPTPNMAPLDDEAREISEGYAERWANHPIESLPGQGYSQSLISKLEKEIAEIKAVPPQVDMAAFAALQKQVTDLTALLAEKPARRV